MVTTARRLIPKAHVGDWFIVRKAGSLPRGVWKALLSLYVVDYGDTVVEYLLNTVAWQDKSCEKILSNAGTTVAAQLPSILHWISVDVVGGFLTSVGETSAVLPLAKFALFFGVFHGWMSMIIHGKDYSPSSVLGTPTCGRCVYSIRSSVWWLPMRVVAQV